MPGKVQAEVGHWSVAGKFYYKDPNLSESYVIF